MLRQGNPSLALQEWFALRDVSSALETNFQPVKCRGMFTITQLLMSSDTSRAGVVRTHTAHKKVAWEVPPHRINKCGHVLAGTQVTQHVIGNFKSRF